MLATMAAEFGAKGTLAGSVVFHGAVSAKPLSGRSSPRPTGAPLWPATAGAAEAPSMMAAAETMHPYFTLTRMSFGPLVMERVGRRHTSARSRESATPE